jgi:hypothetical protein
MSKTRQIEVLKETVTVQRMHEDDYICITDIARYQEPERTDHVIQNWMRNRNTIEFLGIWEKLNNPDFKPLEFEGFKKQAGLNSFILNALFIQENMPQAERLRKLNQIAIQQMKLLTDVTRIKQLEAGDK